SGALHAKRYLLIDRDCKYSKQFRRLVRDSGTKVIRLPPMSPNLNAYAERFVRSIKDECLDRMIFVGQGSLRRAVGEYMTHYHAERNHQGLENRLIVPAAMEAKDGAALQIAGKSAHRRALAAVPREGRARWLSAFVKSIDAFLAR